ncbi:MAG: hypothetical protein MJZ20_06890 [Bacteroidaceae bacterium]|nr:hypothetical protein [Bacteroidaceae bacterium]
MPFKEQNIGKGKTQIVYSSERLDNICAIKRVMELDARLELEEVRKELEDARKERDAAWALYDKASNPLTLEDRALVPLKDRFEERYSQHSDEVSALLDVEEFLEKIVGED